MRIQPVASANQIQQPVSNATEMKAKAISAFNQASAPPQQSPIPVNQNAISVEELGAIQPREQGQPDPTEELVSEETLEAAPEVVEPPKEDTAVSRKFAQLARQEKALRMKIQQQEQSIKTREAALQARETELNSKQPDLSKYVPKDRIKQDLLSVMAEEGLSYDDMVQQLINQTSTPRDPRVEATMNELRNEIKALRQQGEDAKKQAADQQTQAYQAAVKQIKTDVTNLVHKDPAFETIKSTRSVNDVVELIERNYQHTGIVMTIEDAAQQVEDYLVEEAMKLTKIGKIQQRLQKVATTQAPVQKQQQSLPNKQQQPMKTLTNATSSSRQLSAKERAILAFKGEKF